jgi:branched-chain amino acid transport system substrate-binding protein
LDFKKSFQDRFGQAPAFGAAQGYEAVMVLAAALKKTGGKAAGLAQALVGIKNFKGLTDTFDMNRYGDLVRPFYLGTINGGKYVEIQKSTSTEARGSNTVP